MNWQTEIWLLLVGGVFFLMFKNGGCCGGHDNSRDQEHDNHAPQKSDEKPI